MTAQPPHAPTVPARAAPLYHPPAGVVSRAAPGGGQIHVNPRTNTTIHTDVGGHIARVERPGLTATGFHPDGHAGHIEHRLENGDRLVVNRGISGVRQVEVIRPGGVRCVMVGNRGFVEHPYRVGFVSRTYVGYGGNVYVNVYGRRSWGGYSYDYYVPRYYYRSEWYGWAARPWGAPVEYGWGWEARPWYGYYGAYFHPYPIYPSPAFWLTDYLIAASLQASYERQVEVANASAPPPLQTQAPQSQLSPETKQLIANEIAQQLAYQQSQAQQPAPAAPTPPPESPAPGAAVQQPPPQAQPASAPPPAMDPKLRTFVVAGNLDVTVNGQPCALTAGDILYRTGDTPGPDGQVTVNVLNSVAGDCPANSPTTLDVATLQDMHNHFQEQINAGMEQLAKKEGNGLPEGPAPAPQPVPGGMAPADPDAQKVLDEQRQAADATENQVQVATTTGG